MSDCRLLMTHSCAGTITTSSTTANSTTLSSTNSSSTNSSFTTSSFTTSSTSTSGTRTTTITTTSSFTTTSTHYIPCPTGSFKTVADWPCEPCPVGTFNSAVGALSPDACSPCIAGSTTKDAGANDTDLCIRPLGGEVRQCTSGQGCVVNISGFNLQDGHRLAILGSTDCQGALVQVLNAPNSGMSRPATEDSQYVWGDVPADFITEGGIYSLCWCPGMHGILCDDFAQYQLSAGELTVLGPRHDHNFRCVRG